AGGACRPCEAVLASAILYDPASGTFTPTGTMNARRSGHVANLLPDGTVLITGGISSLLDSRPVSSTEVFAPLTGTFHPVGKMIARRVQHTATVLNDGDVLITGGIGERNVPGNSILASAELYHPVVLSAAPRLFPLWHSATGLPVSPAMPAVAGGALSMYTTSLGEGNALSPRVAIGGKFAEVLFFGDAPGYPGFSQVNVRVPDGIAPGANVPVRLTYFGRSSNEVIIAGQ